jgi:predicted DNA binding CopG/RHH family protein
MVTKTKPDLQMVYFRINPDKYAKIKAKAALKKIPIQDYIADILIKNLND